MYTASLGLHPRQRVSSSGDSTDPVRQVIRASSFQGSSSSSSSASEGMDLGERKVEERVAEEVDVSWLKFSKPKNDVHIRVAPTIPDLQAVPDEVGLLAVSNLADRVIVGTEAGFRVFVLSSLADKLQEDGEKGARVMEPIKEVDVGGRPSFIKYAMGETRLLVVVSGGDGRAGVLVYDVKDLENPTPVNPIQTISNLPGPIKNILPNPSAIPFMTLVLSEGALSVLDLGTGVVGKVIEEKFTCVAWSVKGRQFVVGREGGSLQQYTPDGAFKDTLPPPSDLSNQTPPYSPTSVFWLENDLFLVSYNISPPSGTNDDLRQYIIQRYPKASPPSVVYTALDYFLPPFGVDGRSGDFRHLAHIKSWGETKHLAVMASGPSADIGVLRAGSGEEEEWAVLRLDENARPTIPATEVRKVDATVLGMDLDLRSERPVKQGLVGGVEQPDLPPAPRLLVLTSDGVVVGYDIVNHRDGELDVLVKAGDVASLAPTPTISRAATPAAVPTPPAAFGFGMTGSTKPTFGTTKIPAIGKPTALAGGFGASSFGLPAAAAVAAPAFGAPGFGQPAFGAAPTAGAEFGSSTPAAKPAASAFGSSSFGTPSAASPFGATPAAPLAFSPTPSQSSNTASPFGTSTFGASTSVFGKPAASAGVKPSVGFGFGAGSTPSSAFGTPATSTPAAMDSSKPSTSLFGSSQSDTPAAGFGQPAKSSSDSFGFGGLGASLDATPPVTAPSAIEESASPTVPPAPVENTTASFIQPAKSGGFSFGAPHVPVAAIVPFTGSNAAAPTKPDSNGTAIGTPEFGANAFIKASTSTSSTSARFGQSAFGQHSGPTASPSGGAFSAFSQDSRPSTPFGQPASIGADSSSPQTIAPPPSGGFAGFSAKSAGFGAFVKGDRPASPFGSPSQGGSDKSTTPTAATFSFATATATGSSSASGTTSAGSIFGAKAPAATVDVKPPTPEVPHASAPAPSVGFNFGGKPPTPEVPRASAPAPSVGFNFGGASNATTGSVGHGFAKSPLGAPTNTVEPSMPAAASASTPAAVNPVASTSTPVTTNNVDAQSAQRSGSSSEAQDVTGEVEDEEEDELSDSDLPVPPMDRRSSAHSSGRYSLADLEDSEDESDEGSDVDGGDGEVGRDQDGEGEDDATFDDQEDSEEEREYAEERRRRSPSQAPARSLSPAPAPVTAAKPEPKPEVKPAPGSLSAFGSAKPTAVQAEVKPNPFAPSATKPATPIPSTTAPPAPAFSFGAAKPPVTQNLTESRPSLFATTPAMASPATPAFKTPVVPATSASANPFASPALGPNGTGTQKPAPPNSLFAAASTPKPIPSASVAAAVPSQKSAGFGFRQPTSAPTQSSPLAFNTPLKNRVEPSTSTTPSAPVPSKLSQALQATPTRGQLVPKAPPYDMSKLEGTGLTTEYHRTYRRMLNEIDELSALSSENMNHHARMALPDKHPDREDLDHAVFWPFDSLETLQEIVLEMHESAQAMNDQMKDSEQKIIQLKALMHKANTKLEDCNRYARARNNPDFAKRLRVRQLGPEQLGNQQKLRTATKIAKDRLQQLESSVAGFKKQLSQERSGKVPIRSSALENVNRSIENIDIAVVERQQEVSDMASRLKRIRLSVQANGHDQEDDQRGLAPMQSEGTARIQEMSAAALNAEIAGQEIKETLLAARSEPLVTVVARPVAIPITSGTQSIRNGPVILRNLPNPRSKVAAKTLDLPAPVPTRMATPILANGAAPPAGAGFFGISATGMAGLQSGGRPPSQSSARVSLHTTAVRAPVVAPAQPAANAFGGSPAAVSSFFSMPPQANRPSNASARR